MEVAETGNEFKSTYLHIAVAEQIQILAAVLESWLVNKGKVP